MHHDLTEHLEISEPVDFVFHLASPASPIDYLRLPLQTLKVGSLRDPQRARSREVEARPLPARIDERGLRRPAVHPQPETYWGNVNPIGPRGVYDEAKRYAEALTMAYHRQQGVDTCIVRIFNTYGPRMRPHDGRAIPTLHPPGARERAADRVRRRLADAQLLLRRRSRPRPVPARRSSEHLPVNIGNPQELTLLELAETVIRVTGSKSEIVFEALPVDDPQVRQPDITRAQQLLGWEPEISARRRTAANAGSERTGVTECLNASP